jgi:hypothetical protein
MIHHPCQIAHPEWSSTAEENKTHSATTRDLFLEKYSDRPILIIGTHFAAPTAGYIVANSDLAAKSRAEKHLIEKHLPDQSEAKGGVVYRLEY